MARDGLTDSKPKWDPTADTWAYNNYLDRIRIELPPEGDPAASGVVSLNISTLPPSGIPVSVDRWNGDSLMVWSASGTTDLPVYLTSPIPVTVAVDIETDSIKVFSSSGTPEIPVVQFDASRLNITEVNSTDIEAHVGNINTDADTLASAVYTDDFIWTNDTSKGYLIQGVYSPAHAITMGHVGPINLNPSGAILIDDGSNSITVDAVDLDIRDLAQSQDSVRIYSASGTNPVGVYVENAITAHITDTVDVSVSQTNDSIRVYSASGTSDIPIYLTSPIPVSVRDSGAAYTPINRNAIYTSKQTDSVLWTPVSGKSISLLGAMASSSSCNIIEIESNDIDVIPPMYIPASGGSVVSGQGELWRGNPDSTLTVTSSVDTNHSVMLWGYET